MEQSWVGWLRLIDVAGWKPATWLLWMAWHPDEAEAARANGAAGTHTEGAVDAKFACDQVDYLSLALGLGSYLYRPTEGRLYTYICVTTSNVPGLGTVRFDMPGDSFGCSFARFTV